MRQRYVSYLCLQILLCANLAIASDDCSAVRLDQKGGSMEHVPPYDQGSDGVCSAVAATQLFDAYRHLKNPEDKTISHPLFSAAIGTASSSLETPELDGLSTINMLNRLFINGGCERAYIDQHYDSNEIEKNMSDLYEYKRRYEQSKNLKDMAIGPQIIKPEMEQMSGYRNNIYQKHKHSIEQAKSDYRNMPICVYQKTQTLNASYSETHEILKSLYSQSKYDFAKKSAQIHCANDKKTKISAPNVKVETFSEKELYYARSKSKTYKEERLTFDSLAKDKPKRMHDFVSDSLIQKKLPLVITYCSNEIMSPINTLFSSDCGGHASVVIGRNKNPKTGKCMLLIRNSWGDVDVYKKGIIQEGANFWIDEDSIYNGSRTELFHLTE